MRRTGNPWIERPDYALYGALQLHIDPLSADVLLGRDAQRPLDGHYIVHRGDHKLCPVG